MIENISDFFTQMDSQASIFFLVSCIVAFLVGLLIGRLLVGGTLRRLRREIETRKNHALPLEENVSQLREELALKEADLKKARYESQEAQAKVDRMELEKQQQMNDLQRLQEQLERAKITNEGYLSTIEDLNTQILGLKSKLTKQEGNSVITPPSAKPNQEGIILGDAQDLTHSRLDEVEEKLASLERDNIQLRQRLEDITSAPSPLPVDPGQIEEVPIYVPRESEDESKTEAFFQQEKNVGLHSVPISPGGKDDLSRIDGIGHFLEKKLNDIGIFTYQQIAEMDRTRIAEVTKAIQYFEGRIEKDDWVGQAQRLMNEKATTEESRPAATVRTQEPEINQDLTLILGIDDQVAKVLTALGYRALDDIAKSDPGELATQLEEQGVQLLIDTNSWPAQARLAMDAEWDLLKEYQEQLAKER